MKHRKLSGLDHLLIGVDRVVRSVSHGSTHAQQPSPADAADDADNSLSEEEKQHIAALMRINHTGEVCAQALYQGQALTARQADIKESMAESAREEEDHLAWCEARIAELDGRTSHLNPLFYALSFGVGALAGVAGDKWSLGFVAATEEQVCHHLREHLEKLPANDHKTRAILNKMLSDEAQHGNKALDAGGVEFNPQAKALMTAVSKLMTKTTYRI